MPHHKSAIKRSRQDKIIKARNSAVRSRMKTAIKKVRQATNKKEAQESLLVATSVIDKAASKSAIHKNTADRYKSRLSKFASSLPSEKKA